eukprot:3099934-Alexandrium_andersonii.AAC.1
MRNCLRRSKLELRGPRNGPKIAFQSSGRVRSVRCFVQMPNPLTKRAGGRAGGASRGESGGVGAPPGKA